MYRAEMLRAIIKRVHREGSTIQTSEIISDVFENLGGSVVQKAVCGSSTANCMFFYNHSKDKYAIYNYVAG